MRGRLSRRSWQLVHLGGYLALVLSFAHGLGIGTDTGEGWARWAYLTCGFLLAAGALVRAVDHAASSRSAPRELDTVAARR